MSFRTALKESAKSAKTTGKLWSEEFCCVRVCVECLARLQVNLHVRFSCMFTHVFYCVLCCYREMILSCFLA